MPACSGKPNGPAHVVRGRRGVLREDLFLGIDRLATEDLTDLEVESSESLDEAAEPPEAMPHSLIGEEITAIEVVGDDSAAPVDEYDEDEARMKRVLSAWNEHFVHATLPRTLSRHLRDAGFTIRQRDVIPMFNPEYHDNSFAKRALGIMASFAVGRRGVSQEEANAWLAEFAELGKQGRFFFSLNRYLFIADKSAAT